VRLFCEYFSPRSRLKHGDTPGPAKALLGAEPFYEAELGAGIYGIRLALPRLSDVSVIEKALNALRDSKPDNERLDFARAAIKSDDAELKASKSKRVGLMLDSAVDYDAVQLPTPHSNTKPSMAVLGDTGRLPFLSDIAS
jgi:hypothetical protein